MTMRIAIYNQSTGQITRAVYCPADHALGQCAEGEEFYLNCPESATHIINNEPVTIVPEPYVPTLDECKATQKEKIRQARNKQELAGFDYLGKRFDSDEDAMRRIATAVQAAQAYPAFSVVWTCQDNTTIELTAEQMCYMPVVMAAYGNSLHQRATALKAQIDACTTNAEVEAVVW
jgi:hypothetical protein